MSSSGSCNISCQARRFGLAGAALLLATLAGGCASTGAVPRPFPEPAASAAEGAEAVSGGTPAGDAVAAAALAFRGTPYRAAGADPAGFDCSGLVQYVFARQGVAVPRNVAAQFRTGEGVRPDRIEPGDLVFFRIGPSEVSHVGIAVGGGQFVHAPSERGTVRVDSLDSPYWAHRYAGARRLR
jgi:cell wall-associated NlpC family hydrolase